MSKLSVNQELINALEVKYLKHAPSYGNGILQWNCIAASVWKIAVQNDSEAPELVVWAHDLSPIMIKSDEWVLSNIVDYVCGLHYTFSAHQIPYYLDQLSVFMIIIALLIQSYLQDSYN